MKSLKNLDERIASIITETRATIKDFNWSKQ